MDKKLSEWLLIFYNAWDRTCSCLVEKEGEEAYNQIKEQLIHFEGWTPTAKNINVLPEPVRNYIAGLETNADPPSMVRENILFKETIKALEKKLEEKPQEVTMTEIENAVGDTSEEYTEGVAELFESLGFTVWRGR